MDANFEAFVVARQDALMGYAFRLTGDRSAAGDLVQEALIRTGLAWRRVRRRDRPEVYVHVVITRLFVQQWRRREAPVDRVPDRPFETPSAEDRLDVRAALAGLAPRQRAVLVLRYYLGYTEAEIARTLEIAPGTVKSTASDALTRLRGVLDHPTLEDQEGRTRHG